MSGATVVLVADADASGRKLVRALLEPHGYRVLEAWEAGDAVALAIEHRPALVLLDLRLPGVEPLELLATLSAHPLTKGRPVVATTASVVSGEVERCRAAGFADVLVKPISGRDLPNLVRRWCASVVGRRV